MGDWVILRFPFDDPEKPEVIKVLANIPHDWKKYLKKKAEEVKKEGRYIAAHVLYHKAEYFYPESMKKVHERVEKESE